MRNKQLAEMIKRLRKERKENEISTTDINTTSNMKGASHDVAEENVYEQMRLPPPGHKRLTLDQHQGAIRGSIRGSHRNLAGPSVPSKYTFEEEENKTSNNKTTFINTTPEQDSSMSGTQ